MRYVLRLGPITARKIKFKILQARNGARRWRRTFGIACKTGSPRKGSRNKVECERRHGVPRLSLIK